MLLCQGKKEGAFLFSVEILAPFFHIRSSFQNNKGVMCPVLKFNLVISLNTSCAVEQETRYTHRVSHVLEKD